MPQAVGFPVIGDVLVDVAPGKLQDVARTAGRDFHHGRATSRVRSARATWQLSRSTRGTTEELLPLRRGGDRRQGPSSDARQARRWCRGSSALSMYRAMPFDFISATAWIDNNGGIEGYNLPFLPSYMSLAYVAHSNWFVALAASGSYMLFCFWYVALSYLAFPRIIFAWGMDRMGPKWFTSINAALGEPGQELHPLLRPLPGGDRALHLLARRLHAGAHGDRHGDRLGVGRHHHRGAHLPLREARQGHLGVVAVQDLEVPRHPARQLGRRWSPSSTSASSSTSCSSPRR